MGLTKDTANYASPVYVDNGSGGAAGVDTPFLFEAAPRASTSTPVTGTTNASATSAVFTPQLGRPIWLTLTGTWAGTVQVLRSRDGGTTKLPLTFGGQAWAAFSGNANEPIGEETVSGATYYLAITLASGSVSYRVEQ